ncbi:MAG: Gfo/Idh/MocA family protein [Chloroflexota bacterium]
MSGVRIGIVGAGAMGEAHAGALRLLPDVTLAGVVTRTPARGADFMARFGVAAVYPDTAALLHAGVDGIVVATGDNDHVGPTCLALERGVPVLLEKPIAGDVAGAEAIAATVARTGGILVPGHILRFSLPYQRLRAEVAAGALGEIVGVAARRDRTVTIHAHYARVHPAFLTCVHDIDLALWMTGSRVVRVRALEHRVAGDPQPDIVWAQAELASGALATFATAYLHPADVPVPTSDRFELFGTRGVAAVDLTTPALVVHGGPSRAPDWLIGLGDGTGAMAEEARHFVACIRDRRPSPVIGVEDALAGIRVADAIVRSAASGGGDILLT